MSTGQDNGESLEPGEGSAGGADETSGSGREDDTVCKQVTQVQDRVD